MTGPVSDPIAAVAIGRNEGERLIRCLTSLRDQVDGVIYVDSGSTDGSQAAAEGLGATVVTLDTSVPFTAARARNAGLAEALARHAPTYVQFVDGDCEVDPGWISRAQRFLEDHPDIAVVCGRRRERAPEATLWNRLIDLEWDTPVGEAKACGGDALMRVDALQTVKGYNPALIAGEEPELCVRLRQSGWRIWRLDAEMTRHDAAMTRFAQWWKRARRAGHAYAEGAAMHGAPPERHKVAETRRALLWGGGVIAVLLMGLVTTPWAFGLLALWPAQIFRLARRSGDLQQAVFLVLGKLPEALGVAEYWGKRLTGQEARLIEYK